MNINYRYVLHCSCALILVVFFAMKAPEMLPVILLAVCGIYPPLYKRVRDLEFDEEARKPREANLAVRLSKLERILQDHIESHTEGRSNHG